METATYRKRPAAAARNALRHVWLELEHAFRRRHTEIETRLLKAREVQKLERRNVHQVIRVNIARDNNTIDGLD